MISPNTSIITKKMIKQLDVEQTEILKELESFNSWLNSFQFQSVGSIETLKLIAKKLIQT